jgi:hypothetical protein
MMEVLLAKGFLLGAIALGSAVAGLFFLRFWKVTHDRFFLFFANAFFVESLSRVMLAISAVSSEEDPAIYLVRLEPMGSSSERLSIKI